VSIDIAFFGHLPVASYRKYITNKREYGMYNEIIVIGPIEPILDEMLTNDMHDIAFANSSANFVKNWLHFLNQIVEQLFVG
jgi:hypothetical protein